METATPNLDLLRQRVKDIDTAIAHLNEEQERAQQFLKVIQEEREKKWYSKGALMTISRCSSEPAAERAMRNPIFAKECIQPEHTFHGSLSLVQSWLQENVTTISINDVATPSASAKRVRTDSAAAAAAAPVVDPPHIYVDAGRPPISLHESVWGIMKSSGDYPLKIAGYLDLIVQESLVPERGISSIVATDIRDYVTGTGESLKDYYVFHFRNPRTSKSRFYLLQLRVKVLTMWMGCLNFVQ